MTHDIALTLTVIAGVGALALLVQCFAFWGMHRAIRSMSTRVETMSGEVQQKMSAVTTGITELVTTIKPTVEKIHDMQVHLTATSEIVHRRTQDLDHLAQEFTDLARLQIVRVQDLVQTTSQRIEQTAEILQNGVLAPVNELAAILRGLKVGMGFLFRRSRMPSHPSHQDEEMFI